jgi:hypothetical protein
MPVCSSCLFQFLLWLCLFVPLQFFKNDMQLSSQCLLSIKTLWIRAKALLCVCCARNCDSATSKGEKLPNDCKVPGYNGFRPPFHKFVPSETIFLRKTAQTTFKPLLPGFCQCLCVQRYGFAAYKSPSNSCFCCIVLVCILNGWEICKKSLLIRPLQWEGARDGAAHTTKNVRGCILYDWEWRLRK